MNMKKLTIEFFLAIFFLQNEKIIHNLIGLWTFVVKIENFWFNPTLSIKLLFLIPIKPLSTFTFCKVTHSKVSSISSEIDFMLYIRLFNVIHAFPI